MRILFIGPLPDPVTGQALISKVLVDALSPAHTVDVVNLSKKSFQDGLITTSRLVEVLRILKGVWRRRNHADVIYLTISESFAGNLKDILIYLICATRLPKMFIHLHGGSIKRLLWDRHRFLAGVNRVFIRRIGGVIISGPSHLGIFAGMIDPRRVHIAPNCAEDYLFATEREVLDKFSCVDPLRVLFMSNFIPRKGFAEIVDAYFALSPASRERVRIEFAGKFESTSDEQAFLKRIASAPAIQYHGLVDNTEKRRLFVQAHVFCLPTALLEGQPVSILEAYASGCAVVTTGQSGIRDVFADRVNGFEVQPMAADSIRSVLEALIENPQPLRGMALANRRIAQDRYAQSVYGAALRTILES